MSQKGRLYVILITLTAVIITALEILDGTIVSVALNTMRGSLGATIDQMSWTMTAYITATAMFMPLTGFFVKRFGRRPLMLFAISGFGIASVLCGLATNITEIVILRFIQGGVGALLGPLSQGLIVDTFDKEDMGKAMSFYGIGLMTAPILGPIIGAVVTNSLGWRWCFFINVPIVIVALFAVMILLPSVPKAREHTKMDWQGLLWLIVSMGGLEYVLNRGNRLQWFGSNQIMIITVVAVFALIVFMSHSRSQGRRNIVNLTLLGNRDFGLSLIIMIGFAACYISVNAWIPTLLEQLQQYPVLTAGETMIPRGVASLASMIFTGLMIKRLSPILLMTLGMVFFASGCFMLSHFNVHVDQHFFLIANILQGAASGLFFVPLSTVAFRSIKREDRDTASGLFNFGRTVGASIGIASFSNIISRQSQVSWQQLGAHLSPTNPNMTLWLRAHHYTIHSQQMPVVLSQQLNAAATQIAYTDAFHVVMYAIIGVAIVCFFLKKKAV